jgi:hypothetical protein
LAFVIPSELNRVVFGAILALVVYAMPRGIVGFVREWAGRFTPGMPPASPERSGAGGGPTR